MRTKVCLIATLLMSLASPARAGDYTYDLPQLLGRYLGDIPSAPTYDLVVDLGLKFAQIDSASLQLTGTHVPGLVGDLNSPGTFELPAEVIASFNGSDIFSNVFIDKRLPSQDGPFEFDEMFHVGPFSVDPPDFSPWLAGTAEFQFSILTPPTLAIYYPIDMPSVTITSAMLVIQGHPSFDSLTVTGDFNGNGSVDGNDLLAWQRDSGVGSLGNWQTNYGRATQSATIAVPEPDTSWAILLAIAILMPRCSARVTFVVKRDSF